MRSSDCVAGCPARGRARGALRHASTCWVGGRATCGLREVTGESGEGRAATVVPRLSEHAPPPPGRRVSRVSARGLERSLTKRPSRVCVSSRNLCPLATPPPSPRGQHCTPGARHFPGSLGLTSTLPNPVTSLTKPLRPPPSALPSCSHPLPRNDLSARRIPHSSPSCEAGSRRREPRPGHVTITSQRVHVPSALGAPSPDGKAAPATASTPFRRRRHRRLAHASSGRTAAGWTARFSIFCAST